jgi:hypothetical protein
VQRRWRTARATPSASCTARSTATCSSTSGRSAHRRRRRGRRQEGHGYFVYSVPKEGEAHEIKGEWGLGETRPAIPGRREAEEHAARSEERAARRVRGPRQRWRLGRPASSGEGESKDSSESSGESNWRQPSALPKPRRARVARAADFRTRRARPIGRFARPCDVPEVDARQARRPRAPEPARLPR